MRLTGWGAGALVVALLALGLTAAPASASSEVCTPSGCAGSARFVTNGEHFYVHEYTKDGYGVVGYLYEKGADWQWYRVTPTGGLVNEDGVAGPPAHGNYSIGNGIQVEHRACLINSAGTVFRCSGRLYDWA